ncbi:hypothetical protein CANINC_004297 [Pichia inconspicua]|uniref:DUF155 domain-containing protein n=1 Tax=Pichia inconspicua TaxID=52247 RepID=A0A4V6TTP7_9ASCO|nr:hypothetical protein CANINC_004297 [[Candida] inconspicua]
MQQSKPPVKREVTTPTAKRSPSILVTDVRKNQTKAPFAGHKMESLKSRREKSYERVNSLVKSMRRTSNSKYSDISVSRITSNISDIPSSRQRELPRFMTNEADSVRRNAQKIPQYSKTLPNRTSKVTQKLVLIPENESNELLRREKSTTENIFQEINTRTKAERMTKEQREHEYPRVTAYLIAEGFNLKLTSKFLAKYHMVLPRLYDEVLYIPYSLPLLPGENGYRVQSNNSLKMQRGIRLMENFINKSEERDHHYEFYSGADSENNDITNQADMVSHSPNGNDFDPSEPQFFVSTSPNESVFEEEIRDGLNEERSDSNSSSASGESNTTETKVDYNRASETDANSDLNRKQSSKSSETSGDESHETMDVKPRRFSTKQKHSHLPDLSKHAEMFILDYGVVVFWNFSEIHEKNILADLAFAKIRPDEFDEIDDFDDEEEEEDDDEDEDEDEDEEEEDDENVIVERNSPPFENIGQEELSLIIKPLPEQDIETEEFHFEYNSDVPTPRIYNDMITLKSGDHLIKLTMSHAIAQSTKLSLFESKMSGVLNSISKLPKALAITGKLENYTTKRLLTKTGRLFQLRSEVNLLSNVLDTPEYFWSIEPGLHPLYTAVRDYLETEQRVEVINDRCKVFLDFFDILSDSLAERKMTKITKMLIIAIGLSVIVSILEIFVRYYIISKFVD